MSSSSEKEQHKTEMSEDSFPEPVHHTCKLKDGRTLSYYTFDTKIQNYNNTKPVLYLHGFPGMGLEGAICAQQVADAGGQLFAPDRDGFGHSDPTNKEGDERLVSQINDLWEFVEHQKWESFSVIAVSGGGPFALAFLTSYLDKQQNTKFHKLEALSFVCGVCCSAGTDNLMKLNQDIFKMVQNKSKFRLRFMFGISRLAMSILPATWVLKMFPTKDLPKVDQDIMLDPNFGLYMVRIQTLALRQGASATALEAGVLFRPKQGYEEALEHQYKSRGENEFPRIAIFQGEKDVNVPKSHAIFVHEELMKGKPKLMLYDDLGHVSLVVHKAMDYAGFVLSSNTD